MPTIEERALALVNEVAGFDYLIAGDVMDDDRDYMLKALCRALEAHDATLAEFEAFKREVSDAVELDKANYEGLCFPRLSRFILAKPDPLIYLAREMVLLDGVVRTDSQKAAIREGRAANTAADDFYDRLRTALPARGLKLVEVGDAD